MMMMVVMIMTLVLNWSRSRSSLGHLHTGGDEIKKKLKADELGRSVAPFPSFRSD